MNEGEEVKLYVYDLSGGIARQISLSLTGHFFEAIYHTSVIVFGVEYYFGEGILQGVPGQAPYGHPIEIISMGVTNIPVEVIKEHIENLKDVYTPDKYHLLDSNCNNFSNDLCQFLVGKSIPNHILSLPANFLNTSFGQNLRPLIETMFGPSRQTVPSSHNEVTQAPPSATNGLKKSDFIKQVFTLDQINGILSSNRCVVIYFTSQTCPPCHVISPEFDDLINESIDYKPAGAKNANTSVIGVKVETGLAIEISQYFNVTITPKFMFFLDGTKMHEFKGANRAELKSSIDLLQFTAFPPHKHGKIPTPLLNSISENPIKFTASTSLDNIFTKLQSFLTNEDDLLWDSIKNAMKAKTKLPIGWYTAIEHALSKLSADQTFPLLDIMRLLVLDPSVLDYYMKDSKDTLLRAINRYGSGNSSRPVTIMALRLASNLFTSRDATSYATACQFTSTRLIPRVVLNTAIIENVLHDDTSAQQSAGALSFNVARIIHNGYPDDEEWACEIVAAVGHGIEKSNDDEALFRLLATLGLLVQYAPDSVLDLCQALNFSSIVQNSVELFMSKNTETSKKISQLGKEIIKMLEV